MKSWRETNDFPESVKGISVGPALTLATRVRIAILKVISKEVIARSEQTYSWVIQHVSRPVLKIETTMKDGTKLMTSLGYVQAVSYLKKEFPLCDFKTQDLFDAYALAGTRFGEETSHYFILLDFATAHTVALGRKPRKKKN